MNILKWIVKKLQRKNKQKTSLSRVFGISTSIPEFTYVDRSNLDRQFQYLLSVDRHIVIHGASKQGKTILRKKGIPDGKTIVVQCTNDTNLSAVYREILSRLNVTIPTSYREFANEAQEGTIKGGTKIKTPIAGANTEGSFTSKNETGVEVSSEPIPTDLNNIQLLATGILNSGKKVVIEDFHYLAEDDQRKLAFDLKAFWDLKVFFIIVGVWSEMNLLNYYNGDLSGRVEEINVEWKINELEEVLSKGEKALMIHFESSIRQQIIEDANHNVGILQRLAEKYCYLCGIFETKTIDYEIADQEKLNQSRILLCDEERARYKQFAEAVQRGYKGYEESELKVYRHIVRVFIEATDEQLKQGLHQDYLLQEVQKFEPRVRRSDLSAALNKIDKLQSDRSVSPLIMTYNTASSLKKLQLMDRELIFFRKYGNPVWPWDDEAESVEIEDTDNYC